jgi:hypothetical protein
MTSMQYVANDLRKKPTQFLIGVMTVFLTVSFITFLSSIGQLAPMVTIKSAVALAGDFDIMVTRYAGKLPRVSGHVSQLGES